jgi:hypothetical protein
MQGRVAFTWPLPPLPAGHAARTDVALFVDDVSQVLDVTATAVAAWHMRSIWVTPEQVLLQQQQQQRG